MIVASVGAFATEAKVGSIDSVPLSGAPNFVDSPISSAMKESGRFLFQCVAGRKFLKHLICAHSTRMPRGTTVLLWLTAILSWQTPSFSVFLRIGAKPKTFARVSLTRRSPKVKTGPVNLIGSIGGL